MKSNVLSTVAAGFAGALLATVLSTAVDVHASAQDKSAPSPATPQTAPAPDPQRLAGQWHLNREMSTLPPQETEQDPGQGRAGRPGGGSGGGGRRGGFGGGRIGGGYGGRGGGVGGGQPNPQAMLKARALMRELADPADLLTILVTPSEVTITDDRGKVRKFTTDDKKQEIDFGPGATVDVKSKWDADILTQEFAAGNMKVVETYQVTIQGHMMVVSIQPSGGQRDGAPRQATPIKYIYERAE